MIGKLRGAIDEIDEESLLLDVGGVGYLVFASSRTLADLPPRGHTATLVIVTHVREDHIHLYGFTDRAERDWFNLLCTVQGVSVRHALAILSVLAPGKLAEAIAAQDKRTVSRANGVGPKLAGRIVTELKDKAPGLAAPAAAAAPEAGAAEAAADDGGGVSEDAVSALVNLGYQRAQAFGAVSAARTRLGDDAGLDAIIREGLKELTA
ncbi:Holliday junction DNA helicase subunit RuvA [Limimonas halophila]|uniref:Holliday junction branch migration complex subunit RuvA n=1 Tax=Limimonas halophila TaxID=1082479 RepID=A0A1G7LZ60_9PROT|nr:Holliday junction branch migration protein RuvA [Limimonas halophila]SDF54787.1 Holliday junction DNA helicase subunit RuvA [Limimonas halophila]